MLNMFYRKDTPNMEICQIKSISADKYLFKVS